MCTMCVQVTTKTDKGMISPYIKIICNSKPYNVDAGNELGSLPRAALFFFKYFNPQLVECMDTTFKAMEHTHTILPV